MDEADKDALKDLLTKMSTWLPRLSVRLWEHDDKKDSDPEINAALRLALKPKAQLDTNDDVDQAMDDVDASNPSSSLIELIRKEQKRYGDKQMVMLKRQMRKNYSADDKKNQSSKAKNGQESKNTSKASKPKKTGAPANPKKDNKGKSKKQKKTNKKDKKDKKDKADEPKQKSSKASRKKGSQGGSNKGGKGSGAARR